MAEHPFAAARNEMDPDERKRRLSRVYTILLDLAYIAEKDEQEASEESSHAASEEIPVTAGA